MLISFTLSAVLLPLLLFSHPSQASSTIKQKTERYGEHTTSYIYTEIPEEVRKKAQRIFQVLRCPVCQNIPLSDSYTEISETMKKLIIRKLKEGWSENEIIDYFVRRYGKDILLEPEESFYSLVPIFSLLIGVGILAFILLRSTKRKMAK